MHAKRSLSIFKLICSVFRGQRVVSSSEGNAWAAVELAAGPSVGVEAQTSPLQQRLLAWAGSTQTQTHRRIVSESPTEEIRAIVLNIEKWPNWEERDGAHPSQDLQVHTKRRTREADTDGLSHWK